MSEAIPEPEDERGYWTITLEGGPALAGNLALALRIAGRSRTLAGDGLTRLAAALDSAQFTPVRDIEIRRRSPEEIRARLLSSSLPPGLASALADEMATEGT